MSIEKAIITREKPLIVQARVDHFLRFEMKKGCDPRLNPLPVALEPQFAPLGNQYNLQNHSEEFDICPESVPRAEDLIRFEIWLSPKEEPSWLKSEIFLKQLFQATHRIGLEIIGNQEQIHIGFLVHQEDRQFLETSYSGSFECCELKKVENFDKFIRLTEKQRISFIDLYPPPPYCHLVSRPEEFKVSPYQALISALMKIKDPDYGFYQAVFQPVHPSHNWHMNVETLLDIEYTLKLLGNRISQRQLQQAPSGDLRQMAKDVETKSHNDKPFYFIACRIGAVSASDPQQYMKSLKTFFSLFQHGGRPMQYITDQEYRRILSADEIMIMFLLGLTYRPGFLVNSFELSGPVHIPRADILSFRTPQIKVIKTLLVENPDYSEGTLIGTYDYLGETHEVHIPPSLRPRSTHLIGKSGTYKTTTLAHMILDDIRKKIGVAVIDPHGDLIEKLLLCIPEEHISRTVYVDFNMPGFVPIWNPLHRSKGQDVSRITEDIVGAFKMVFRSGWGDRMEHLFRHLLYALLHVPDSSLLDLSRLLYKRDKKNSILDEPFLQQFIEVLDNEVARQFWQVQVKNYEATAFDPPKHRLDKLLLSGKPALMLSQPDSLINFRQIMDEGKILLVKLSLLGKEVTEVLGCFILSLLHLTTLGRGDIPEDQRKPYQFYVDETHRFLTDALEDIISEARKYNVGLNLAHQYFSQFEYQKVDALSSVGTTIILGVDQRDAGYLAKDLRDEVTPNDIINLKLGEAVARIGTDIFKIRTLGPLKFLEPNFKDEILKYSVERYYRTEEEVKDSIKWKNEQHHKAVVPDLIQKPKDDLKCDFDSGF